MRWSAPLALLGLLAASPPTLARTWHITPDGTGDAPTIQAGIDSSAVADTVLVATGTYLENLTLRSGVSLVSEEGAETTVIDGQGLGSVVTSTSVTDLLVRGFTIQNGVGSGGSPSQHGGGLALHYTDSTVVIQENVIRWNQAWDGGGMLLWDGSGATIVDNRFESNEAHAQTIHSYGAGGAILITGVLANPARPTIRGNVFFANRSDRGGSAISSFNYCEARIENNLFVDNECSFIEPPNGAVLAFNAMVAEVRGNTLADNVGGYAIRTVNQATPNIASTLIVGHAGQGTVTCTSTSIPTISCSDFWNNTGGDWPGLVADQLGMGGNVSADPLFCSPGADDYHIRSDSPCAPENSSGCSLIGALDVTCAPPIGLVALVGPSPSDSGFATGAAWIDLEDDHDSDLAVARSQGSPNLLYRNDGSWNFNYMEGVEFAGSGNSQSIAFGDYDNDGDPDCYVSNANQPNHLLRNDGGGVFVDATPSSLSLPGHTKGCSWVDCDRDGLLDLFVVGFNMANHLFVNEGDGVFSDAGIALLEDPGPGAASAWSDFDGDGDPDLYLSQAGSANKLYRNEGNGTFVDCTLPPIGDSGTGQGVAWGDCDNDGDLDLYVSNFGEANKLFRNDGFGLFEEVTSPTLGDTGLGQSGTWADFDNDGDLDLVLTNFGQANTLFRNDGDYSYEPFVLPGGNPTDQTLGAAWGDGDSDGDLDLFLTNYGQPDVLLRNDLAPSNRWIHLDLVGTTSNRSAIGARVTILTGGSSEIQIREVGSNHGFWSDNSPTVEFGLGDAEVVDFLMIRWPLGLVETFHNVAVNRRVTVVEGSGALGTSVAPPASTLQLLASPNPFTHRLDIRFNLPPTGPATLAVFDVLGRRVRTLVAGRDEAAPGLIQWDGRSASGASVAPGVYFLRLEAAGDVRTQKVVRLRD